MPKKKANYGLEISQNRDYLHVKLSGTLSLAAGRRAVEVTEEACRRKRCTHVLFDQTAATGELPLSDRFEIGVYAARKLPSSARIAVLAKEDQIRPHRFFESVARNRDMDLRLFSDREEALQWLKMYSSVPPDREVA